MIKFLAGHRDFIGILFQPAEKVFTDFVTPLRVDLSGRIAPFAKALYSKLIAEGDKFGGDHQILNEMRRNEYNPAFPGQDYIAGKNGSPADADRDIDAAEHHFLDIGRIIALHPRGESFNFFQTFHVPHRSIEDYPVLRLAVYGVSQVVADERAIDNLAVAIGNVHIAGTQHINRPGVEIAYSPFRFALLPDHGVVIWSPGKILDR